MQQFNPTAIRNLKRKVDKAFRALTKQGFECHRNFWCCQSCGCAAIEDDKPYAFWHWQDEDRLRETGKCHIAHGYTTAHARAIVAALTDAGVSVEWDGNTNRRILILAEGAKEDDND